MTAVSICRSNSQQERPVMIGTLLPPCTFCLTIVPITTVKIAFHSAVVVSGDNWKYRLCTVDLKPNGVSIKNVLLHHLLHLDLNTISTMCCIWFRILFFFCHPGHWKCKDHPKWQQQSLWEIHRDRLRHPLPYHRRQHENISAGEITSGVSGERTNAHSSLHERSHEVFCCAWIFHWLALIPAVITVCYSWLSHRRHKYKVNLCAVPHFSIF